MKIGIVNTGGDVQSLNAIISSATKYAIIKGHQVIGFRYGWEGILDKNYVELNASSVRGISHVGGTVLRTTNKGRFAGKVGEGGDTNQIPQEILQLAKTNLEELGIEALIEIGGDGGISSADQLAAVGVNIVGIPKSIDNDLDVVEKTPGFSSAVTTVREAMDRLHTTATSHDRVILVETMGRHTGWIALYSGLSGGASIVLIPEVKFSYHEIIRVLRERKQRGVMSTLIVVAEGASASDEGQITQSIDKPEVQLGGISNHIISRLEQLAPGEFEMRATILGHIQRGGAANTEDNIMAKIYGTSAIDAIEQGQFGKMLVIKDNHIEFVHFKEAVNKLKLVTRDHLLYQTVLKVGGSFGEAKD